jgi:hypothetical protein
MVKKAKYSSHLTEQDNEVIEYVILICGAVFYNLINKYHSPKEYAEKVILKVARSKKDLATGFLIFSARKEQPPNQLFWPDRKNSRLAKVMQQDQHVEDDDRYLHPRALSEILNVLAQDNIYDHIYGKKEIKHLLGRRKPGKRKNYDTTENTGKRLGGKPSAYKISKKFEALIRLMEKPEACEAIRKVLVESKLAYKIEKFVTLAFYFAVKKDPIIAQNLFRMVSPYYDLKENDDVKEYHNLIASLDDSQLEKLAEDCSKITVEKRIYDVHFLIGLLKLSG